MNRPIEFEIEDPQNPKKRRRRNEFACLSCRKRKAKCNQGQPCGTCVKHDFVCEYVATDRARQSPQLRFERQRAASGETPNHHIPGAGVTVSSLPGSRFVPIAAAPAPAAASGATRAASPRGAASVVLGAPLPPAEEQGDDSRSLVAEDDGDSLGDVNQHTKGTEYYGAMGAFPFLSKLRRKARTQSAHESTDTPSSHGAERRRIGARNDASIVNLLHSADYPVDVDVESVQSGRNRASEIPDHGPDSSDHGIFLQDMERECARLYFRNLHWIHPILDRQQFLARCEKEVWTPSNPGAKSQQLNRLLRRRFQGLYNIVLAIGAITAGDESELIQRQESLILRLREAEKSVGIVADPSTYTPLRIARVFFEKAKHNLGDIFETCSLETTQTLFLMSIFCQNALKPHSCYLYNGMAMRTALAIGMPSKSASTASEDETLLWWALYSYEIEICAAAGRQSSVGKSGHFRMPLPAPSSSSPFPLSFSPSRGIVRCMVLLAELQDELSEDIYQARRNLWVKSKKADELQTKLSQWKGGLPTMYDFDNVSLKEPEAVTKQKIILKLRFNNTQILLHRPFLSHAAAAKQRGVPQYETHVELCVGAAQKTIELLYDAYLNRPYIRTWWYNCTYVLYASMILLYVVLTDLQPAGVKEEALLGDSQKSLEIFRVMEMVSVSRKCAEITQEVLEAAEEVVIRRRQLQPPRNVDPPPPYSHGIGGGQAAMQDVDGRKHAGPSVAALAVPINAASTMANGFAMEGLSSNELAGLIDVNLMDNLFATGGNGADGGLWPDVATTALLPEDQMRMGPYGRLPGGFGHSGMH